MNKNNFVERVNNKGRRLSARKMVTVALLILGVSLGATGCNWRKVKEVAASTPTPTTKSIEIPTPTPVSSTKATPISGLSEEEMQELNVLVGKSNNLSEQVKDFLEIYGLKLDPIEADVIIEQINVLAVYLKNQNLIKEGSEIEALREQKDNLLEKYVLVKNRLSTEELDLFLLDNKDRLTDIELDYFNNYKKEMTNSLKSGDFENLDLILVELKTSLQTVKADLDERYAEELLEETITAVNIKLADLKIDVEKYKVYMTVEELVAVNIYIATVEENLLIDNVTAINDSYDKAFSEMQNTIIIVNNRLDKEEALAASIEKANEVLISVNNKITSFGDKVTSSEITTLNKLKEELEDAIKSGNVDNITITKEALVNGTDAVEVRIANDKEVVPTTNDPFILKCLEKQDRTKRPSEWIILDSSNAIEYAENPWDLNLPMPNAELQSYFDKYKYMDDAYVNGSQDVVVRGIWANQYNDYFKLPEGYKNWSVLEQKKAIDELITELAKVLKVAKPEAKYNKDYVQKIWGRKSENGDNGLVTINEVEMQKDLQLMVYSIANNMLKVNEFEPPIKDNEASAIAMYNSIVSAYFEGGKAEPYLSVEGVYCLKKLAEALVMNLNDRYDYYGYNEISGNTNESTIIVSDNINQDTKQIENKELVKKFV